MRLSFAVLTLAFLAPPLAPQTAPEVEITAEPHHHLVLENAYVRVFNVDVAPGTATVLHRHRHDYVFVAIGKAQVSNEMEGKPSVSMTLQDGQTIFSSRTVHAIGNLGSSPFHNVTVEFLQDKKAPSSPSPSWDEERGLDILHGGTKDILLVRNGVRVSDIELQPGGMLPGTAPAGPQLLIAVTNLSLHSGMGSKAQTRIDLHAGDVKWFTAGAVHDAMNMGKQKARFVLLEFR